MQETVEQVIEDWDAGHSVWSIEMGGLGPGYEQAIQVLAMEIIRDWVGKDLPDFEQLKLVVGEKRAQEEWDAFSRAAEKRVFAISPGYSGAQVGAAKNIAFMFLKHGPAKAVKMAEQDRHIQVSRTWPKAPEAPSSAPLATAGT